MDRGTRFFWILVTILAMASVAFGFGAEKRRRGVVDKEATLATGDIVQLQQVVDGDNVLVTKEGQTLSVRLLGIKAFSPTEKGPGGRYGQEAKLRLGHMLENQSAQVLLNTTQAKDTSGRYLAELFVDDRDVGLELVKQGLALVYSKYPFATMTVYLQEQEKAKAQQLGLWGDPETAKRAKLLSQEWRKQAK